MNKSGLFLRMSKNSHTFAANLKTPKLMKRFLFMTVIMTSMVIASSCNVVWTITNESQYYQRGDTSVVIQTRTVESYDATKKL